MQRRLEIISEASRHLPEHFKRDHNEIPWKKVAGIGNILRHDYERIAPEILWQLVKADLPPLIRLCRDALERF